MSDRNDIIKKEKKKEQPSIVDLVSTYIPYWPLFILFMMLSFAGAYLYLRYKVPLYEANATIIIKDERKGYDDSKLIETLDLINTKKIIENEVEVLQSRNLMNEVVKKLHLYAPILQEGKLQSISAYNNAPLVIESANPDSLQISKKILLEYDADKGVILLDKTYRGLVNEWLKTPYGVLRFVRNDKFVSDKNNKPYYFTLLPSKLVAAMVSGGLKISPSSKLSSVINLTYTDVSPKIAEDILNELIIAYGEAALKEKNVLAKNTLTFIESRLSIVSKDLDSIEAKLQQYKAGRGAVDISKQGQIYLENVSNVDKQLSDVNMQVAVMDQLEKTASNPANTGVIPSTLGVNDPALIQQMSNLSTLQQQYDKLKTTVGESNPMLITLADQINKVKPSILNNIKSQRKNLEQSRSNLYASGGMYNGILSTIPQKEKQLLEISRDQNIKQGIYSFLLQKREESELSYASNLSDSKIVNYAMASNAPVSPKKLMIFIAAFAIGLSCPIAFVTIRESLSPKVLYRNEVESLTNIPVIGEINYSKEKNGLVVKSGVRTVIAEEFRKIRVSLLALGIDKDHKKILVTSSISGEGKSFVSANLATSISLTGKKVVLVDLDLHNPGLGEFFGIKEQPGVSDYLIESGQSVNIVLPIEGNEKLHYISSGILQQDASELLENGRIQMLIKSLEEQFDFVIIDTAPVVLITDAYLLSNLCDATLYVVRHKFTPKMLVKRIDESMNINPIKNPGIIFNGVRTRGYFKNNYGYGYNYVYSYENKKGKKIINS